MSKMKIANGNDPRLNIASPGHAGTDAAYGLDDEATHDCDTAMANQLKSFRALFKVRCNMQGYYLLIRV